MIIIPKPGTDKVANYVIGPKPVKFLVSAAERVLFGVGIKQAADNIHEVENKFLNESIIGDYFYNPDEPDSLSFSNGQPVFQQLEFTGQTYIDLKGNPVTIPTILFQTVLINLDMNKNIEESSISGRDTGKVKESISMDDWTLEIRAIITKDAPVDGAGKGNPNGAYPYGNMRAIWKLLKSGISIPVVSTYLNQFDIFWIVIKSANMQQVEGEISMQRLVINAVSDNPLVINIGKWAKIPS
jgi:hypothetical protein